MSQTFSLVCHETKQSIWIGQGWGKMTTFYSGDKDTMERLKAFLVATAGKPLFLACDDRDETHAEYEEFGYERGEDGSRFGRRKDAT